MLQEAGRAAGKGLDSGAKAEQGVNTEALGRLMNGGASGIKFERISIAISFFQNFGLLGLMKLNWPSSFQTLFKLLEPLRLDLSLFAVFGGEC